MAIIIKDLAENVDLDHQAMVAVIGGIRSRGRQTFAGRTAFRSISIMPSPAGGTRIQSAEVDRRLTGSPSRK